METSFFITTLLIVAPTSFSLIVHGVLVLYFWIFPKQKEKVRNLKAGYFGVVSLCVFSVLIALLSSAAVLKSFDGNTNFHYIANIINFVNIKYVTLNKAFFEVIASTR